MTRLIPYLAPLLLVGLTLLAASPYSHSKAGVLQLFLFSTSASLGFLLFGGQRFETTEPKAHRSA